jgi:hypothetical protein
METETAEVTKRETNGGNVDLTVTNPVQMPHLQSELVEWCRKKVGLVEKEIEDAEELMNQAAASGFKRESFERMTNMAAKRKQYYAKILAALEEGYVMMPTLDADIFAIRTKKKYPKNELVKFRPANLNDAIAEALPQGEGRYVSNRPEAETTTTMHERTKNYQTGEKVTEEVLAYMPSGFDDEIVFPLNMARPEIMEVTSKAMLLKLFDEFAVAPRRASGDPVIMGRIIAPGTGSIRWSRTRRRISFLIAWNIPTIEI